MDLLSVEKRVALKAALTVESKVVKKAVKTVELKAETMDLKDSLKAEWTAELMAV